MPVARLHEKASGRGMICAMTLAPLDPVTALLCVDLQVATANIPSASDMTAVVANNARLVGAFRQHQLPVAVEELDAGRVDADVVGPLPGRSAPGHADTARHPDRSNAKRRPRPSRVRRRRGTRCGERPGPS